MAIVVGDIHGDVEKAWAFLDYKPEELHIALGDYLDSFIEPFEKQLECLELLMKSKAVLLLGNHEVHYLLAPLFKFPGYQVANADMLQNILEVQNPEYTGHPIRFELDTESGSSWTLNPVLTGQ